MPAGMDGEPRGRGQVRVLLQSHRLVQMILYYIYYTVGKHYDIVHIPQSQESAGYKKKVQLSDMICPGGNDHTHLAHILIHLLLCEWALVFVVPEEPQARSSVQIVVSNVEVIGPCCENANLILPSGWFCCSWLFQSGLQVPLKPQSYYMEGAN